MAFALPDKMHFMVQKCLFLKSNSFRMLLIIIAIGEDKVYGGKVLDSRITHWITHAGQVLKQNIT
jgi:hypothetical protein